MKDTSCSFRPRRLVWLAATIALAAGVACGDDETEDRPSGSCVVGSRDRCDGADVCQAVDDAEPRCLPGYTVRGTVLDLIDQVPIAGAVVTAVDDAGVGASRQTITAGDGTFSIVVPLPHTADLAPRASTVTLFAQASRYATFPDAPRRATRLDVLAGAGTPPVLENADTRIFLQRDAVAPTEQVGDIEGRLEGKLASGALVSCAGKVGMADLEGRFVLFDVPSGSQKVEVYRRGAGFELATVDVPNRERVDQVTVRQTSSVAANLTVTFAGDGATSGTDVALALADTYDAAIGRGFVPPSLAFAAGGPSLLLDGVPRGKYVVLTLSDDGFTLDPAPAAGQPRSITVSGDATIEPLVLATALELVVPGSSVNPIVGTPTFSFRVVPAADAYQLELFDSAGARTWTTNENPTADADGLAEVAYDGPDLVRGVVYQLRVTALAAGQPIAISEIGRGGFFVPAQ